VDTSGNITPEGTREALRVLYRRDPETNLQKAFLCALSDDLKPVNKRGGWNPSSLLVLLSVFALALAGIFFYFSMGRAHL
jgi:hypothetical protein